MIHHTTAPSRLHLLVAACLALCGGITQAADPTPADLNSIVLYGSTTIAQDSTDSWGVWDQLEPTAAGPALPRLSIPGLTEWYRSLSQVAANAPVVPVAPVAPAEVLATQICAGGSICGFFRAAVNNNVFAPSAVSPTEIAYSLVATPVQTDRPTKPIEGAIAAAFAFSKALTIQSQALSEGGVLLAPQSGLLTSLGSIYSGDTPVNYKVGTTSLANKPVVQDGVVVPVAWFDNPVSRYVVGQGENLPTLQFQNSVGVVGVTTSDAEISKLRASNATANYTGYDVNGLNAKVEPNVKLTVNFGNGTFNGSLNDGADRGVVQTQTTTRGTQLAGLVGVKFQGVATGANLTSTAMSATDGKIGAGSLVQLALVGPNAAAAIGVVNLIKTSDSGAYKDATYVTPVLVVRNAPAKSGQ